MHIRHATREHEQTMSTPEDVLRARLEAEKKQAEAQSREELRLATGELSRIRTEANEVSRRNVDVLSRHEYFGATLIRPMVRERGVFRDKVEGFEKVAWKLKDEKVWYVDSDLNQPVWIGADLKGLSTTAARRRLGDNRPLVRIGGNLRVSTEPSAAPCRPRHSPVKKP
jgi:hypothetical protein